MIAVPDASKELRCMELTNMFKRKVNMREVAVYTASSFIICIAFAVMLLFKQYSAFDTYMSFVIPLIIFSYGLYTYCSYHNSSIPLAFSVSTLNTIGFSLMCLISPDRIVTKHLVAMVASIIIFIAIQIAIKIIKPIPLSIICLVLTVAIYVVLNSQPEQNHAQAWLVIGGISLQLTEIIKLLFILSIGLVYSSGIKDSTKLIFLVIHLVIHSIFSLFINELGSLLILLIVGFMIQLLFGGKKQNIIMLILAGAGVAIAILLALNKDNLEDLKPIIEKVISRLTKTDPYQVNQAQKAFVSGGIFGSVKIIPVFASTSDFAFTSLSQNMGLIVASGSLILYISLLYLFSKEVAVLKLDTACVIAIISVITITTQSAYIILANIGLTPVAGVTTYFISDSGTGILIAYLLTILTAKGLSKERRDIDERAKRIIKA